MYTEYLQSDDLFVVAEDNSEIIGFCMGFLNGSQAMRDFYKKFGMRLACKTLLLLLKGNSLAWEKVLTKVKSIWRKIKQSKNSNVKYKATNSSELSASLLSICVLPKFQGSGASRTLIEDFEKLLYNRKVKSCYLSTWRDNARAIRFYEKMGYRVCSYYGKDSVLFVRDL